MHPPFQAIGPAAFIALVLRVASEAAEPAFPRGLAVPEEDRAAVRLKPMLLINSFDVTRQSGMLVP